MFQHLVATQYMFVFAFPDKAQPPWTFKCNWSFNTFDFQLF